MESRWLVLGGLGSSVPVVFVGVVFWLTIVFGTFGLFALRKLPSIAVLLPCALSVSGLILRVLEMNHPFDGPMKVSTASLRSH
jgi:hypothetical protein